MKHVNTMTLMQQFRAQDATHITFLDYIRTNKPTERQLLEITSCRVICECSIVSEDIYEKLLQFPEHQILTMTKTASHFINHVIIEETFNETPLASMILDDGTEYPIYKQMRLMLTRNCNKDLGFVNRQFVSVITVEGNTVVVKTSQDKVFCVYPITDPTNHMQKFPCLPGYATTIAKMQGRTLSKVILWFDTDTLPAGTHMFLCHEFKNYKTCYSLHQYIKTISTTPTLLKIVDIIIYSLTCRPEVYTHKVDPRTRAFYVKMENCDQDTFTRCKHVLGLKITALHGHFPFKMEHLLSYSDSKL